jgi:hypothetical protein
MRRETAIRFRDHAFAFLGYLALTLFFLRPAAAVLATHFAPDPGDPLFNLFVLKWGVHEMRTGMHGFWDAPMFFPAHGATTFSDHLLGPAAFATLFTLIVPNALAAYNLLFLGSFVLCGFNTWFVLRRSGVAAPVAFLGGCMFAFSSFRWDQLSHIQVLLMQWIPVTLWSWDRLLAAPSARRGVLFFLFYALHVTGGSYLGYMIHFPLLVLLAFRAPDWWRSGRVREALRVMIPVGLAAGLLLAALYVPYLTDARKRARMPSEILEFGASLVSYVTPAPANLYAGWWAAGWKRPENSLFAGFLPTLLALLAAAHGWVHAPPLRPLSRGRLAVLAGLGALVAAAWLLGEVRVWAHFAHATAPDLELLSAHRLGVFAAAAALLAFGLRRSWGGNWPLRLAEIDPWERGVLVSGALCFLLSFPLVYLPLMRVIPGLSGMRVPARFAAFVSFSLVYFAARELDRRLRGLSPAGRRLAAGLVAALLILDLAPRPVEWRPIPPVPAVYRWLARQPDVTALLELPLGSYTDSILPLYFATFHWKPLVNGYSGYLTDDYVHLRETCCWPLPDDEVLARLRGWGVSHILLHRRSLNRPWKRREARRWAKRHGVRVEYKDAAVLVYRITPVPPGVRGIR